MVLIGVIIFLLVLLGVLIAVFLLPGDNEKEDLNDEKQDSQNSILEIDYSLEPDVFEQDTNTMPAWIARGENADTGPWNGDIYLSSSNNGLDFTGDKFFMSHSGVPNLITTRDGDLIATFQYFSFVNEGLFDKIVYTISADGGQTWSKIKKVEFSGLTSSTQKMEANPNPVDPTLVQLEDGTFRLYFTYQTPGDAFPNLYSAKADTIDGTFVSEGQQLEVSQMVLDPAVVYFDGVWHHYTAFHEAGEDLSAAPVSGTKKNVHSTSSTGIDFIQQDDVYADMTFLGDVINIGGKLRFYGTDNGVKSAISPDGVSWTMESGTRVDGADPGVAILESGTFVILYSR